LQERRIGMIEKSILYSSRVSLEDIEDLRLGRKWT
jgi:hypothetical protein